MRFSLVPRDSTFFDLFSESGQNTLRAAKMLDEMMATWPDDKDIGREILIAEQEGDRITHDIIKRLNSTFVTPIDREDLQKLSKRIDDVLDLINASVRACVLFGVAQPTTAMALQITKLAECTAIIAAAVPKLRTHAYAEVISVCSQVHQYEKDGDVVFRDALSALFHDPAIDAKTILREKEVLEDLEKAINRCDQASELLINIAVKNS